MATALQFDIARHAAEARTLDIHAVPRTPHAVPGPSGDHVASALCKLLRRAADLFLRKRCLHGSVVRETVAVMPGLVPAVRRDATHHRDVKHQLALTGSSR